MRCALSKCSHARAQQPRIIHSRTHAQTRINFLDLYSSSSWGIWSLLRIICPSSVRAFAHLNNTWYYIHLKGSREKKSCAQLAHQRWNFFDIISFYLWALGTRARHTETETYKSCGVRYAHGRVLAWFAVCASRIIDLHFRSADGVKRLLLHCLIGRIVCSLLYSLAYCQTQ